MRKLFIVLVALTMSGCVLTDIAYDVVSDWKDSNNYEAVRSLNDVFCDADNYGHLVNKYGKEKADKLIIDQCNANTKSN